MKSARRVLLPASLFIAVMSGCATGMLATPREHFAMRPDVAVAPLIGSWEAIPLIQLPDDEANKSDPVRIVQISDSELLFEIGSESYELRLIPYSSQVNRYLAEIQQVKLGDMELKQGLSALAVISIENDTLSIWYLNGITLANAMREDGRSGNFQHHLLVSEIDADPQDIIRTIEAHAAELLSVPVQYRAVESPQDLNHD